MRGSFEIGLWMVLRNRPQAVWGGNQCIVENAVLEKVLRLERDRVTL